MADFTANPTDNEIISGVPNPGIVNTPASTVSGTVNTTVMPIVPQAVANTDPRYADLNAQEQQKLAEYNQTYDQFLNENQALTDQQQKLIDEYASQQKTATQAQTDLALEQINQQKAQSEKDFTKSATGAYADYTKEQGAYGVGAEQRAAGGLASSGYSESSRVSMFNAYQNRVALAKDGYLKAVLNYDNSMKEARLNNSTKLAEIAYQQLQSSLALSLQSFQTRQQLAKDKLDYTTQLDNTYYNRYQDVLNQINMEKQQAEQIRQWELDRAWEWEQWHQAQMNWQAEYDLAKSNRSGGGDYGDDDPIIKKTTTFDDIAATGWTDAEMEPAGDGENLYRNKATGEYAWYTGTGYRKIDPTTYTDLYTGESIYNYL